jgi:Uma2 family endonuclease
MAVQKKLVTVDDFERFLAQPENADKLFELIDGEIIEKVPTEEHGVINVSLSTEIKLYARQHGGRVAAEARHGMPNDPYNDRIPDIAYTSPERAQALVKQGTVPQMPDLAVEVKSPDDSYAKMRRKAAYYLENGSRMVWLVFPEKRQIEVYSENGDLKILDENDSLDGGNVMPGFTMPVPAVFEE